MAARALLFDIEGTLCDTRCWYEDILVQEFGCDRTPVRRSLAGGRAATLLARSLGIRGDGFVRACRRGAVPLKPYPAVADTLRQLVARATPIGAVTNLPPALAEAVLDAASLRSAFGTLIAWRRGVPPKPSPAPLRAALQALRVEVLDDVYYIGDSDDDAAAARAAHIRFAWTAYGYTRACPAGTAVRIDRFEQVATL
jgi:phosphoglycolate phosphatase